MKRFYLLLAVVAVVGVAAVLYGSRSGAGELPARPGPVPPAADGFRGFTQGSDTAPVEVVEYSDFECPWCARFAAVQMPVIRRQLIETGRVRWRYRDFPLDGAHRWARLAAHAAHCAGEQNRFWEMHDQLFYNHGWAQKRDNPAATFRGFAQTIGLDVDRYVECMESGRHLGRIEASLQEGQAAGVNSTPTFFMHGRQVESADATSDGFKAAVDSIIAAESSR